MLIEYSFRNVSTSQQEKNITITLQDMITYLPDI